MYAHSSLFPLCFKKRFIYLCAYICLYVYLYICTYMSGWLWRPEEGISFLRDGVTDICEVPTVGVCIQTLVLKIKQQALLTEYLSSPKADLLLEDYFSYSVIKVLPRCTLQCMSECPSLKTDYSCVCKYHTLYLSISRHFHCSYIWSIVTSLLWKLVYRFLFKFLLIGVQIFGNILLDHISILFWMNYFYTARDLIQHAR